MMKKKGYAKGGMKKKGYAKGGMPMTKVNGMSVPKFAADGKGANDMKKGMKKGGMMKKKAYAKGGKVAMYNQGGMVKSTGTIPTGIANPKNTYK
jgi:hypothetical protein